MHPFIDQQLAADRIDRLTREADARRLADLARPERPQQVALHERVLHAVGHAVGRVHLVHRGSAA